MLKKDKRNSLVNVVREEGSKIVPNTTAVLGKIPFLRAMGPRTQR
jgi:hypothetical protein